MKNLFRHKKLFCCVLLVLSVAMFTTLVLAMPASAESGEAAPQQTAAAETQDGGSTTGTKALAAGIAVGLAAAGGAIAMGWATAKTAESISRQPEAEGKIRTSLMLGLVFIETAIIYALLVVILIIFVL